MKLDLRTYAPLWCGRNCRGEGNEMEGIRTVENLILTHAVWVPVTAEADYDEAVLFGHLHSRLV